MTQTKKETTIKELIFDDLHRANQGLFHALPGRLILAFNGKAFARDIDPETQQPFASLHRWLITEYPLGCGLCSLSGLGIDAILAMLCETRRRTAEDKCATLDALIEDLVKGHGASKGKGGRPKKGEEKNLSGAAQVSNGRGSLRSNRASTLAARLAESTEPSVQAAWRDYLQGTHKTVHAAAVACGLKKGGHEPLPRLKQYWRNASPAERKAFLQWIKEQRETPAQQRMPAAAPATKAKHAEIVPG